ncbi:MAG: hypothetical protein LQ337_004609 [Flavoplaca oasis]|nr:MAG: hypothetical protein LQ337_004609 [Flavoplaca oasis]
MTAELEAKVRLQLQQDYRDCKRGKHCRAMKDSWRAESGIFRLDSVEAPPRAIHQSNVSRFCNKATVFYWAPSAQRYGGCPGIIFGAIYKAWFRYYNDKPGKLALDYDYFFANLVKVTTNGPKTIPGIVKAHRSLSDQVVSLLSRMRQECKTGTCPIRDDKLLPHHQLQLLSRAIVVIYDNFIEPYVVREPRVRIFLDEVVQQQNVLLVLTGDDHELSAPISFDSIKCESLPTAQEASDGTETGDSYDMIRVPLNVAIQFILDLQQRESVAKSCPWTESTIAEPTNDGPSSDAVDRDAAEYADSIIRSTAQGRGREDDSAKLAMGAMNFAAEMVAMRERGEEIPPALGVDMIEPLWE